MNEDETEILDVLCSVIDDPQICNMRNVGGELFGAITAMMFARQHEECDTLILYYDYNGISKWATGEWKRNNPYTVKYKELYDELKKELRIIFRKVKAHSGNKYNEKADALAKSCIF